MNYQEYLETRQLLKRIYHDLGVARKTKNIGALNHIKGTILSWFTSINNPKLYYVYEPHEYLSNPYLVRLRKEFPEVLQDIDKSIKQIRYAARPTIESPVAEELPEEED